MKKKLLLISLSIFSFIVVYTFLNNNGDASNEMIIKAPINISYGIKVASDDSSILKGSKEKLGYEMNNKGSKGFIKVNITKTEKIEGENSIILGSGNGVININKRVFAFDFDNAPITKFLYNNQIFFSTKLNGYIKNIKNEQEVIAIDAEWDTNNRVQASASVGVIGDYGLIFFGERFVDLKEITDDNLLEFE